MSTVQKYRGFVLALVDDGRGAPYVETYYEGQFADGAPIAESFAPVRAWVDEQWELAGGSQTRLDAQFGIFPMPVKGGE